MLRNDIQQALVPGIASQEILHRYVHSADLPYGEGVLQHPGKDDLGQVLPILLHVQEDGIVYAILDFHIVHDLPDLRDDCADLLPAFRKQSGEEGLIFSHIIFGFDPDHPVFDPDGNVILDEFDVQAQVFEHWEQHTRVLHRPDAAVIEEAIALKRVHEAPAGFLLLAEQGCVTALCQIGGCGQPGDPATDDNGIIFHIHSADDNLWILLAKGPIVRNPTIWAGLPSPLLLHHRFQQAHCLQSVPERPVSSSLIFQMRFPMDRSRAWGAGFSSIVRLKNLPLTPAISGAAAR